MGPEGQRTRGPEDQRTRGPEDQRTKEPENQRTRGPEDQRTRGPEDQGTRGPEDQGTCFDKVIAACVQAAGVKIKKAHARLMLITSVHDMADRLRRVEPSRWAMPQCTHECVCPKCGISVVANLFECLEYEFLD